MDQISEQIVDEMDKQPDQLTPADEVVNRSSRRKFTRSAVASSAVLLSLGNRPAWSTACEGVSAQTWASYYHPGGAASLAPNTAGKIQALEDEIQASRGDDGIPTKKIEADAEGCRTAVEIVQEEEPVGEEIILDTGSCWKGNPNAPGRGETPVCES